MEEKDFVELYEYNLRDYAAAVNEERAIPDARSGLKPIHTKILYEMYADKVSSTGKFRKNAYMVGQLLARFTPHGDTATYDALVRLAQPWIQRYPLIDFHGNYGSAFGDGPAAMRYTESKLSGITEDGFLQGLNKDAVDWKMNFSNEEKEPTVLPAIFPGLFCLPNQGMGYGCSCNFLTYNLQEVADAVVRYIEHGEIPTLQYDVASGGTIVNPKEAEKIKKTGKGSIIIEAAYTTDKNKIYFTELPFNQSFDSIFEKIAKLYDNGDLPHVKDFINDSGKGNLKLTIVCDNAANVDSTLALLLDKTPLRASYAINQVALVDGTPKLLSHKDMIDIYVTHNLSCIKREYQFDLTKTLDRIEILEGLERAYNGLDNVINLIRDSKSATEAKSYMTQNLGLTDRQADAILALKLSRLAKLEKQEILDELATKRELAKKLQVVVDSEEEQTKILIQRLQDLAAKHKSERRTKVVERAIKKVSATKVAEKEPEPVVVCYTKDGYIKSVPAAKYRAAEGNLGGIETTTDGYIQIYNTTKVYRLKVSTVKQCLASEKGTALGTILGTGLTHVRTMAASGEDRDVIAVSKTGRIKKFNTSLSDGTTQNIRGQDYFPKNEVAFVFAADKKYLTLTTDGGKSMSIDVSELKACGKTSTGRIGIKLDEGDFVTQAKMSDTPLATLKSIGSKGC